MNKIIHTDGLSRIEQKPADAPYCPNAAKGKFELYTSYGYSGTFESFERAKDELDRISRASF